MKQTGTIVIQNDKHEQLVLTFTDRAVWARASSALELEGIRVIKSCWGDIVYQTVSSALFTAQKHCKAKPIDWEPQDEGC